MTGEIDRDRFRRVTLVCWSRGPSASWSPKVWGPVMVAKGVGPVMVVVAAAEGALQQRQQGPRPVQSREGVLW